MNKQKNTKVIAIAGNPNCGKTTLFNGFTGASQRIGNWPGVTVEKKEGVYKSGGSELRLIDLPGIYSLTASTEDERVARDFLLKREADLVINIVDGTNLERNLYFTLQLIEMRVPVLIVVNMMDLVVRKEMELDLETLSKQLGYPVIGVNATKSSEIERIKKLVDSTLSSPEVSAVQIQYPNEVEEVIEKWNGPLSEPSELLGVEPRWLAVKLLEKNGIMSEKTTDHSLQAPEDYQSDIHKIESILQQPSETVIADYKYGFIHAITASIITKRRKKQSITDSLDKVAMHRFFGIPVFLLVMYCVFWVTINIGGVFIDFFDLLFGSILVDGFGALLFSLGAPNWLIAVLAGGLGTGIQTLSTFIPIIFTMFLTLSLLEDSGYMARAAFIMDKFMGFLGLPGKSFIPLIVGFGCTVPAIMATRTLEYKKDRYLTIFIVPLMSCGARLPVYAFFAAAFFSSRGGLIVYSFYIVGIVIAIGFGLLLKKTIFSGEASPFIMELPPYHTPRLKHIMIHTWNRLKVFILKAGKFIVIAVMLLGFLNSFGTDGTFGNENSSKSVLAGIGKAITPIFTPIGVEKDNWPATVAIFTGLFAKEAIVGTINSLYGQMQTNEYNGDDSQAAEKGYRILPGIKQALISIPINFIDLFSPPDEETPSGGLFETMRSYFPLGGKQVYAYLLFILIYFPCVSALGAAVREMGAGLTILSAGSLTVLAYSIAVIFFQVTLGGSLLWILIGSGLILALITTYYLLSKKPSMNFSQN
jgi:ferrous iron transport protein B